MAVWGRERYLSVTEAPHNIESLLLSGEEKFRFIEFRMPERGNEPAIFKDTTKNSNGQHRSTYNVVWDFVGTNHIRTNMNMCKWVLKNDTRIQNSR